MLKEKIFQTLYNVVLTNDHIKKIKMIVGIGERADDAHKQHLILKDQQSFIDSQLAELHSFDRNLVNKLLTNTLMALSVSDAGINDNQKRQIIKASILISKRLLILKGIIGIEPISNHSNVVHYMDVTTDNLLNDDGSIMYTFTPKSHPVTLADLSANAQYINDLAVTNNEVFESLYIDKIVYDVFDILADNVVTDLVSLAEVITEKVHTDIHHSFYAWGNINSASHAIYHDNHMGAGNYIICHPSAIENLTRYVDDVKLKFYNLHRRYDSSFQHIGSISDGSYTRYRVYTSMVIPTYENMDSFLIGYNQPESCRCGYVLAPLVSLWSTGVTVDLCNFKPIVSLRTKYGNLIRRTKPETITDSTSFYRMVQIEHYKGQL